MKKEQVLTRLKEDCLVAVVRAKNLEQGEKVVDAIIEGGINFIEITMNLTNIILQNSYVVILILGMLPIILTGNIDLSVGSVLAFVGAIAAIMQVNFGCGVLATLVVSLAAGCLIGAWQGLWVAYFDIPAFIVTLSGELVFRGLTQVILDGASIGPFSDTFRAMASSFIPDFLGGNGFHVTTMVLAVIACGVFIFLQLRARRDKIAHGVPVKGPGGMIARCVLIGAVILYLSYQMATYQGYPTVLLIMLVLSLGVMGLSGFSTPYQIDQPYSIYAMTYGQYFLLTVLCGYIASLLAASVTMLIAARMRSASVAVCVPFLLFCVMPFIGRALSAFLTFFKLTPDMLVNVIGCAKAPNIFQAGNLVFRQIPCVMLVYSALAVILLPFVYKSYHCYNLK